MVAKLGDVVTWHWAHRPDVEDAAQTERCNYGETPWHLAQKALCNDPGRIEVSRNGRRADVLAPYEWAIEFQHSNIPIEDARAREADWKHKLVWVADGTAACENESLDFWKPEGQENRAFWTVQWSRAPQWVREIKAQLFIHLGDPGYLHIHWWYQTSPLKGRAGGLSQADFASSVINGPRPPKRPQRPTTKPRSQSRAQTPRSRGSGPRTTCERPTQSQAQPETATRQPSPIRAVTPDVVSNLLPGVEPCAQCQSPRHFTVGTRPCVVCGHVRAMPEAN
jgi:hypothetical protein